VTNDVMGGDDDGDELADALGGGEGGEDGEGGEEEEDDNSFEIVGMAANVAYLAPVLRILALLHSCAAIAMMIGYYCLKVSSHCP